MSRHQEFFSKNASIFALLATFVLWSILLLFGWTMIFCGSEEAVLASETKNPADLLSRVYFAGFTITTLGTGNYIPNGPIWQLLSVMAAANGFFIVTICVTYTFSVLNALNERRAIGVSVGQLAATPVSILDQGGDEEGRRVLTDCLQSLTQQLQLASVKTDIYPVIEYTHVPNDDHSFAIAVATLGELCLLNDYAIASDRSLASGVIQPLWRAIELIANETELANTGRVNYPLEQSLPQIVQLRLRANWQSEFQEPPVCERHERLSAWLEWHHRDWASVYSLSESETACHESA